MESLSGKKRILENNILIPIPIYPKFKIDNRHDIFEPRPENKFRIPTEITSGYVNKYKLVENNFKK